MRSISNPLSKIRKTATEIANGNFVKSKIKGKIIFGYNHKKNLFSESLFKKTIIYSSSLII